MTTAAEASLDSIDLTDLDRWAEGFLTSGSRSSARRSPSSGRTSEADAASGR